MLEYYVSLYTDIYWTKRVFVALAFILVICTGIRIFQLVSDSLAVKDVEVGAIKPEVGYGPIPPLNLKTKSGFEDFKPSRFRISTVSGNLNAENGYPLENTQSPIANVYRIIEQPIDLSTTQEPLRIARDLNFSQTPQEISNTTRLWQEGGRKLLINGQYKTIEYSNENLKTSATPQYTTTILTNANQDMLKNLFRRVLVEFKYSFPLGSYIFTIQYLNYDPVKNKFVISETSQSSYYRIEAIRSYPNLSKGDSKSKAYAVYPEDGVSNIYIILINSDRRDQFDTNNTKVLDQLVELKLYAWPISTSDPMKNQDIQTYPIITPQEAYKRLTNHEAFLISAKDSATGVDIEPQSLEGVELVDVLTVKLAFYEEPIFSKYIQPVYVFIVECQHLGKKYILNYYVPAIAESYLLL
jgi:hypothetical protein